MGAHPLREEPGAGIPLLAAAVRLGLGFVVGLPIAVALYTLNKTAATLIFTVVRFTFWSAVTVSDFPKLPASRAALFAMAATAANWVIDSFVFGGHWMDCKLRIVG